MTATIDVVSLCWQKSVSNLMCTLEMIEGSRFPVLCEIVSILQESFSDPLAGEYVYVCDKFR